MISLERYSNVYEIESPVEEWYSEGWSTCQRETTLDLSTPFEGNKKKSYNSCIFSIYQSDSVNFDNE